jgi:hypothetical protein
MKTKQIMVLVVLAIFSMTFAGEVMARGGNGAGNRNGSGSQAAQSKTAGSSTIRPADSQRRDGTFLSSGTTANGSASRPANGNGLRDGSGMVAPVPAASN